MSRSVAHPHPLKNSGGWDQHPKSGKDYGCTAGEAASLNKKKHIAGIITARDLVEAYAR